MCVWKKNTLQVLSRKETYPSDLPETFATFEGWIYIPRSFFSFSRGKLNGRGEEIWAINVLAQIVPSPFFFHLENLSETYLFFCCVVFGIAIPISIRSKGVVTLRGRRSWKPWAALRDLTHIDPALYRKHRPRTFFDRHIYIW